MYKMHRNTSRETCKSTKTLAIVIIFPLKKIIVSLRKKICNHIQKHAKDISHHLPPNWIQPHLTNESYLAQRRKTPKLSHHEQKK